MKTLMKIIILIALILASLTLIRLFGKAKEKQTSYKFAQIERGDLLNYISGTGTLETVGSVEVGTQVSGTVESVMVDFNDFVKKNQVLAVLDTTQLALNVRNARADVKKAQAQYNLSRKNYENNKKLYNDNFISEWDLETSLTEMTANEASYESAKINLEKAELNLYKYAVIRSPIDGRIINRDIEPGQTIAASLSAPTLFLIAKDLSQMEIYALIDESDIGQIKEGQKAKFTVDAYSDKEFSGTVKEVRLQPQTISNVVNYTVIVDAANPENILLPGMTATIDFLIEEKNDVLLVSASALNFKPDEKIITELMKKKRSERANGKNSDASLPDQDSIELTQQNQSERKMLWYLEDGELNFVFVRAFSTDGEKTEISGKNIKEGMEVIAETTDETAETDTKQKNSMNFRPMPF